MASRVVGEALEGMVTSKAAAVPVPRTVQLHVDGLEARVSGKAPKLLSPAQRELLRGVASLDYKGNHGDKAAEILGLLYGSAQYHIARIYRALEVSDVFAAVAVTLDTGILSLEELAGSRMPDLKLLMQQLTVHERHVLRAVYASALKRSSGYNLHNVGSRIYRKVPIAQNRAQLAVLAHALVKLGGSLSPKLTTKQHNRLKAAASLDYQGGHLACVNEEAGTTQRSFDSTYRILGVQDIFSAVARALDKGIYTVDELAGEKASELKAGISRLTDLERTVLAAIHSSALQTGSANYSKVASQLNLTKNNIIPNAVKGIYRRLGEVVQNQAQLAVLAHAYVTQTQTHSA